MAQGRTLRRVINPLRYQTKLNGHPMIDKIAITPPRMLSGQRGIDYRLAIDQPANYWRERIQGAAAITGASNTANQ
jgi:hypothetical protein